MANPTIAKDLVLHFFSIKEYEITPNEMAKSMVQMKDC